ARTQPPEIVGNLGEADRVVAQRGAQEDNRVLRCLRFEMVPRLFESKPGPRGDLADDGRRKAFRRIEPRTRSSAAKGEFMDALHRRFDALSREFDLPRVSRELLPQPHWNGILQMRTRGLDDIVKPGCFGVE